MKKVNFSLRALLLILVSLQFTSCNKEQGLLPDSNDEITVEMRFNKLTALPDISAQQISFDLLNPDEKKQLWVYKFTKHLEKKDLSRGQKFFIKSLIGKLDAKIFDRTTSQSKVFQLYTLEEIMKQGREHFTEIELYKLLFTLDEKQNFQIQAFNDPIDEEEWEGEDGEGGNDGLRICLCTVGSRYTCVRPTGWIPWEYGECTKPKPCVITNSGCGGLMASDCDGSKCTYS